MTMKIIKKRQKFIKKWPIFFKDMFANFRGHQRLLLHPSCSHVSSSLSFSTFHSKSLFSSATTTTSISATTASTCDAVPGIHSPTCLSYQLQTISPSSNLSPSSKRTRQVKLKSEQLKNVLQLSNEVASGQVNIDKKQKQISKNNTTHSTSSSLSKKPTATSSHSYSRGQAFLYKQAIHYNEIITRIKDRNFMERWLSDKSLQREMALKTKEFRKAAGFRYISSTNKSKVYLQLNSSIGSTSESAPLIASSFQNSSRAKVYKSWRAAHPENTRIMKFGGQHLLLVKDCVGLWTVADGIKATHFHHTDCVNAYSIEHIVSNSFGVDNCDEENAVPMDVLVNKIKSNLMLFEAPKEVIKFITSQREAQERFFDRDMHQIEEALLKTP